MRAVLNSEWSVLIYLNDKFLPAMKDLCDGCDAVTALSVPTCILLFLVTPSVLEANICQSFFTVML